MIAVQTMQEVVQEYIKARTNKTVKLDIESHAKIMPRKLKIEYTKNQLIKLTLAYHIADYYLKERINS